jgi:hypothetical protein
MFGKTMELGIPMSRRLQDLIEAWFDESLTTGETEELNAMLRHSAAAREQFRRHGELHGLLYCAANAWMVKQAEGPRLVASAEMPAARHSRLVTRPMLAAASLGLLLGVSGLSVAWGLTGARMVTIASAVPGLQQGGFEGGAESLGQGFPQQLGKWSGDSAEIVDTGGVSTKEGNCLLRFQKVEGDPSTPAGRAVACDLFQLVDLRSLRSAGDVPGHSILELSAHFMDARQPSELSVTFYCQLFLFSGDPESMHREWPMSLNRAVSSGSGRLVTSGRRTHGAPWQEVTARCLVSGSADFAVVQLIAMPNRRVPLPEALFVDDVSLTLKSYPALPVQIAGNR